MNKHNGRNGLGTYLTRLFSFQDYGKRSSMLDKKQHDFGWVYFFSRCVNWLYFSQIEQLKCWINVRNQSARYYAAGAGMILNQRVRTSKWELSRFS